MASINLSYVLTTYNKLDYLKVSIEKLVNNKKDDEEIVVSDGGSTDGSAEYLNNLYKEKKIDQFISEPDLGEAHGLNKCILMAKGQLIKTITDDDVYYYPSINKSKEFMLENESIDVLCGNLAQIFEKYPDEIRLVTYCEQSFNNWLLNNKPGWFCCLPLMMRRKSFATTGLFHTGAIQVDTEFTYRITSLKGINIAWNKDIVVTRIDNAQSNLTKYNTEQFLEDERKRIKLFYKDDYRGTVSNTLIQRDYINKKFKVFLRNILNKFFINKNNINYQSTNPKDAWGKTLTKIENLSDNSAIDLLYKKCEEIMKFYNDKTKTQIVYKTN
jgi:glycosyltransferase involved in cell wall biosynthesis